MFKSVILTNLAFMYTYYTIRAANIRVSKQIAMIVTTLQILQMVVGVIIGKGFTILKLNHHV